MRLLLILITMLLCINNSYAQEALNYQIIPLDWEDFTIVSNTTNYTAKVAVANKCEIGYITNKNEITIELETSLKIDKNTSTVARKFMNSASLAEKEELLDHEKGHVLISIIYQYKLVDEFKKATFTKSYKSEVRNLIQKITEEKERTNQIYDLETNHHLNKEAQSKWDNYFFEELRKINGANKIEWALKAERKINL